jgi:hypothetical protein
MNTTQTVSVPARRRYAGAAGDVLDAQLVHAACKPVPPPPTTSAIPRPVAPLPYPLPPANEAIACLVPSLAITPDLRKLRNTTTRIVHVREALNAADADRPDLNPARFRVLPDGLQDEDTFQLLVAAIVAYDRPLGRADMIGRLRSAGVSHTRANDSASLIANTWRPWRALLALAEARTLAAGPAGHLYSLRDWTLIKLGLAHQVEPSFTGDT